jgi:hypothetical protein
MTISEREAQIALAVEECGRITVAFAEQDQECERWVIRPSLARKLASELFNIVMQHRQ